MKNIMKIESIYINTDLDIVSNKDLSDLVNLFKKKCELLHSKKEQNGLWYMCIEAKGSGMTGSINHNPTNDLIKLLKIVEDLPKKTISLLKKSKKFDFNIGWQSSKERPEGSCNLPNQILQRIAKIGATITFTVYPSNENEIEK